MQSKATGGAYPYILYIDDDADDLNLVSEILKEINPALVVHTYDNGKKGFQFLEWLNKGDVLPSLIILDLNMPGWDGLTTLKAIKNHDRYRSIPVCVLTNSDHPQHISSSLEAGAFDYFVKPYKIVELDKLCRLFAQFSDRPVNSK